MRCRWCKYKRDLPTKLLNSGTYHGATVVLYVFVLYVRTLFYFAIAILDFLRLLAKCCCIFVDLIQFLSIGSYNHFTFARVYDASGHIALGSKSNL